MMENKPNTLARSNSPLSPPRIDLLAAATLVGVVVMLTMSLLNAWTLRRLSARVAAVEAQIESGRTKGPDPRRVHAIRTAGAPTKGPDSAPVTIVEFSDFQCPFCAKAIPTLRQIQATYGVSVRIVWKHLPLQIHKDAVGAARAAEAAGKQGKFWELHDKLFANQARLGLEDLKQHARELQLDMTRFEADLLNTDDQKKIDADVAEALALGVSGTPGFFINGRFVNGAQPFETFAAIIDEELNENVAIPSKASAIH